MNRLWNLGKLVVVAALIAGALALPESGAKGSAPGSAGVRCRIELDRAVLPVAEGERAVVKVTLDAPPAPPRQKRPAVNLALVLDRSGSMRGTKLQKAKEAAIEALRRLGPRDIFAVVTYDTNIQTIVPAQHATNIAAIEERIRAIRTGGSTALFGGVSQGAAEVRKNLDGNYVHRIVLLSDGLANVGPQTPEDLGRLGTALIKEDISVTTVGVGVDYNEDLMTRLADRSDGNTYFVENSNDLPRIFTAELGDVLSIVAKKVVLIIECPEGVLPVSIIGRDGRIKGRTVELSLNQLYGGQEKYALVEVTVPKAAPGERREIAVARISYDDPFTQRRETALGRASARFSADRDEVAQSFNKAVQRDYFYHRAAVAVDNTIVLSDEGKVKQAVRELRSSARELKQAAQQYNDKKLEERASQLEQQAEDLDRDGMTKKKRKGWVTDNYQFRKQQMTK